MELAEQEIFQGGLQLNAGIIQQSLQKSMGRHFFCGQISIFQAPVQLFHTGHGGITPHCPRV